MGPRREQQSWVWISDFNGFGLRNLNPAIALHANKLFSTYYAERLGCFMLVPSTHLAELGQVDLWVHHLRQRRSPGVGVGWSS
jgi:hypothetical protein